MAVSWHCVVAELRHWSGGVDVRSIYRVLGGEPAYAAQVAQAIAAGTLNQRIDGQASTDSLLGAMARMQEQLRGMVSPDPAQCQPAESLGAWHQPADGGHDRYGQSGLGRRHLDHGGNSATVE